MSDLKELKLDLEYLLGIPDGVFGDREVIYGDLAEAALAAISTLEAKLAVAREALGKVAACETSINGRIAREALSAMIAAATQHDDGGE